MNLLGDEPVPVQPVPVPAVAAAATAQNSFLAEEELRESQVKNLMSYFPEEVKSESQARKILAVNGWSFEKTIETIFTASKKLSDAKEKEV